MRCPTSSRHSSPGLPAREKISRPHPRRLNGVGALNNVADGLRRTLFKQAGVDPDPPGAAGPARVPDGERGAPSAIGIQPEVSLTSNCEQVPPGTTALPLAQTQPLACGRGPRPRWTSASSTPASPRC